LRELRNALAFKKMSFVRFYNEIDDNGDGLISVDEFLKGINSVIKLALPIR